jgi:hypothetical protein
MTAPRLSRLQKRMLCWLSADERRTRGVIASSHQELVQAMPSAKGNRLSRYIGEILYARAISPL